MKLVTFIIPSIGRTSLHKTIESLRLQTCDDWCAIVMYDCVEKVQQISMRDKRIKVFNLDSKNGHAGLVRNGAFCHVETDWIGFVDDDDTLDHDYVKNLKKYLNNDIVIFSFRNLITGEIHPNYKSIDFKHSDVGISFAIRKEFIDKYHIRFASGEIEDYYFLDACRRNRARYVLTNEIMYYANGRNHGKYF